MGRLGVSHERTSLTRIGVPGAFANFDSNGTQRALIVACALCFIFAMYRVWVSEHKTVEHLEESLLPNLVPQILNMQTQHRLPDDPSRMVFTVFAQVRNLGAPSVITKCFLAFLFPDKVESLTPIHFGAEKALILQNVDHAVSLPVEDLLLKKGITPIPTGGMIQGYLSFVTHFKEPEIEDAFVCLYCVDVRDKTTIWCQSMLKSEGETVPYIPGMNTQIYGSVAEATGQAVANLSTNTKKKRKRKGNS